MKFTSKDRVFMQRALELAEQGRGKTTPNPMVGAVIVRGGKIVGEGYHPFVGGPHAEVMAIENAKGSIEGSHIYVSLEPCCTHGRTPPCTDSLIQAKIKSVTIASLDPNKNVHGKGVKILRARGMRVRTGLLAEETSKLNSSYFHFHRNRQPWMTLKAAITIDGYIAANQGSQSWISSKESRRQVHLIRAEHDAILVGSGTVLNDDPRLNVRIKGNYHQPLKVILDSALKTPLNARILKSGSTLIAYNPDLTTNRRMNALKNQGVELLALPQRRGGKLSIQALVKKLTERGITSILIEGGAEVFSECLRQKQVNRLIIYVAPTILGCGSKGKNVKIFNDLKVNSLDQAFTLKNMSAIRSGRDIRLEGYLD